MGPDPRSAIAAEHAGSALDFNEKEASRREDQYVYFIDRSIVRNEFEVGPDAIGIAVGGRVHNPMPRVPKETATE
jgi:hypothetical protein